MSDKESTGTEIATVEAAPVTLMRPLVSPDDLIAHHQEVTDLIGKALKKGQDYGVIPGTGKKPTLLKPGAERISIAFGCAPMYSIIESEIDHDRRVEWKKRKKKWNNKFKGDHSFTWIEESGTSLGLYRYVTKCELIQSQTGRVVATGIGTCSSMESKYIDRPRDVENTIVKMSQKRSFVAAVLNGFGLSDRFSQDLEDTDGEIATVTIGALWKNAHAAGVDVDTWKEWCREVGIEKDHATHTRHNLAIIEDKINDYYAAKTLAPEKPSSKRKSRKKKTAGKPEQQEIPAAADPDPDADPENRVKVIDMAAIKELQKHFNRLGWGDDEASFLINASDIVSRVTDSDIVFESLRDLDELAVKILFDEIDAAGAGAEKHGGQEA